MAIEIPQVDSDSEQGGRAIQLASNLPELKLAMQKIVKAIRRLEKRQDRIISEIKNLKNKVD